MWMIRDLVFDSSPASFWFREQVYLKAICHRFLCYWSFSQKAEKLQRMKKSSKRKTKKKPREISFHESFHHDLWNWVTGFRKRKKGRAAQCSASMACSIDLKTGLKDIRIKGASWKLRYKSKEASKTNKQNLVYK